MRDDVVLVVSELVTNAVHYGVAAERPAPDARAEVIWLTFVRMRTQLACLVGDSSDEVPRASHPDWVAERGRGLGIVEALCDDWGFSRWPDGGKVVYALFPLAAGQRS
jgi:two-component sensor histidine kinase